MTFEEGQKDAVDHSMSSNSFQESDDAELMKMLLGEMKKLKTRVTKNEVKLHGLSPVREQAITESGGTGYAVESKDDRQEVWRKVGSGAIIDTPAEEDNLYELEQDVYTFLAVYPVHSMPFWLGLIVVFGFQLSLLLLLLANQTDFQSENPLQLPENVEISVRVSQVIVLIAAMFMQDDLMVGIVTLVKGVPPVFQGADRFQKLSRMRWTIASLMRMLTGIFGLLAALILSIQANTVFDVVLNVLGVEFVSNLDNVAFELGSKGYFGRFVKRATIEVAEAQFYQKKSENRLMRIMHIIVAMLILTGMMIGLAFVFMEQDDNALAVRDIQVQFVDEEVTHLGLFNGCYAAVHQFDLGDRRLLYEQLGFPKGGKFGFCSDFGDTESGWTFFVGDIRDPCDSYLARSEDTQTFSILEAASDLEWSNADGDAIGVLDIAETEDAAADCGKANFETTLTSCPQMQGLGSKTFLKLNPQRFDELNTRQILDVAVSHTIYYSQPMVPEDGYDIIFFSGIRWVWTTTTEISELKEASNYTEIEDYFYGLKKGQSGFFRLVEDLLRTSESGETTEWVRFISEAVNAEQKSPIGLEWFYPLHKNDEREALLFPAPDPKRPLDEELLLACVTCNSETNPCLFEGICDDVTGQCKCENGALGPLCEEKPAENGICNLFFNSAEHNFDGNDCCGQCSSDQNCGKDDLPDPFANDANTTNWMKDGNGMLEILNKDDEWISRAQGRTIAFGVNVTANITYQSIPLRYEHCADPELASIEIGVVPTTLTTEDSSMPDLVFDGVKVQCGENIYLQTPIFGVNNYSQTNYTEMIRVPYGASCKFEFEGPGFFQEVSLLKGGNESPFLQLEQSCSVELYIPQAKCIWETFAKESIAVSTVENQMCISANGTTVNKLLSKEEFDVLGSDTLVDELCQNDTSQLLERYHVWDILKSGSGQLLSTSVGHVCDGGWDTDDLSVSCNSDKRVTGLTLKSNITASFIDSMAANVKDFALLDFVEVQAGDVVVDRLLEAMETVNVSSLVLGSNVLPSSIGLMTDLRELRLSGSSLSSLPSEIGLLTNLEHLTVQDTSLVVVPSQVGNLTALSTLDLSWNRLIFLPSELGNLASLERLVLNSNRLSTLPKELENMVSLQSINIANNTFTTFPSEISWSLMSSLTSLDVTGNPLPSIPTEILSLPSLNVIGV